MNKLSPEKRCAVIRCLVEGCSIRSTVRITGVSKNAIQRLTIKVGKACLKFQDKMLRDRPVPAMTGLVDRLEKALLVGRRVTRSIPG